MPIYTEIQQPLVLNSSNGDNIYTSYVSQILSQHITIKNDNLNNKEKKGKHEFYDDKSHENVQENESSNADTSHSRIYEASLSTKKYLDYRQRMQSKLLDLNNNMSCMVRESFESIDNICNKVREYISDMENRSSTSTKNLESVSSNSMYELEYLSKEEDKEKEKRMEEVLLKTTEALDDTIISFADVIASAQEVRIDETENINADPRLDDSICDDEPKNNMRVIEENVKNDTPLVSSKETLLKASEDDLGAKRQHQKMQWLSKQKKFIGVFRSSMQNIENFVTDMNKYVENINTRIESLKDNPTWNKENEEDNTYEEVEIPQNIDKETRKHKVVRNSSQGNIQSSIPKQESMKYERAKTAPKNAQRTGTRNYTNIKKMTVMSESLLHQIESLASANDVTSEPTKPPIPPLMLKEANAPKTDVMPDVTRIRAVPNLHERLVMQLEANDSYLCFQRLMEKTERRIKKEYQREVEKQQIDAKPWRTSKISRESYNIKPKKPTDLPKMFNNSLWFSKKSFKSKKISKQQSDHRSMSSKSRRSRKLQSLFPAIEPTISKSGNIEMPKEKCPIQKCGLTIHNESPTKENPRTKVEWIHANIRSAAHRPKMKYCDILDVVRLKDLQPLKSEYPRKDNVTQGTNATYLYQLIHDKQCKPMLNSLLKPMTCSKVTIRHKKNSEEQLPLKHKVSAFLKSSSSDGSLNEKIRGQRRERKRKSSKEANRQASKQLTKSRTDARKPRSRTRSSESGQYSRRMVCKKLTPYIFPSDKNNFMHHSVVVMPVNVVYNNPPKIDLKRTKNAEITSVKDRQIVKSKTMYTTKQHPRIPTLSPTSQRTSAYFSKYFAKATNQSPSSNPKFINMVQTLCCSSVTKPGSISSKSAPPRKLERFNTDLTNAPQSSVDLTRNQALSKTYKLTTNTDQKTTINDPKKIVLQRSSLSIQSRPLTATPPVEGVTNTRDACKERRVVKVSKLQVVSSDENDDAQTEKIKSLGSHTFSILSQKRKKMLDHLKGLKNRNEKIKDNIQKAIDVIESKMVDILSKAESQNLDAFDAMEKEITNVLKLMKSSNSAALDQSEGHSTKRRASDTSSDVNSISDELYRKLQSIIDSSSSAASMAIVENRSTKSAGSASDRTGVTDISVTRTPKQKVVTTKSVKTSSASESSSASKKSNRNPKPKKPSTSQPTTDSTITDNESPSTDKKSSRSKPSQKQARQASKMKQISVSIKEANNHIEQICKQEFDILAPSYSEKVITRMPTDGKNQKVVIFKALESGEKISTPKNSASKDGIVSESGESSGRQGSTQKRKLVKKKVSANDNDKEKEQISEGKSDTKNECKLSSSKSTIISQIEQSLENVFEISANTLQAVLEGNENEEKEEEERTEKDSVAQISLSQEKRGEAIKKETPNADIEPTKEICAEIKIVEETTNENNDIKQDADVPTEDINITNAKSGEDVEQNSNASKLSWLEKTLSDVDIPSSGNSDSKSYDGAMSSDISDMALDDEEKTESSVECPIREMKFIENMMDIIHEVDDTNAQQTTNNSEPVRPRNDHMVMQDDFAESVQQMFRKMELVYKKLDDGDNLTKEEEDEEEMCSCEEEEKYLIPTKDKVKENDEKDDDDKSLLNIINFLDALNDIVEEGPTEVFTAREVYFTQVWYKPVVFHYARMQYFANYSPQEDDLNKIPLGPSYKPPVKYIKQKSESNIEYLKKDPKILNNFKYRKVQFLDLVDELSSKHTSSSMTDTQTSITEKSDQPCQTDQKSNLISMETQINNLTEISEDDSSKPETSKDERLVPLCRGMYDNDTIMRVKGSLKSRSYIKLISQTMEYFKDMVEEPHLLKPLKNIELFLDTELSNNILNRPETIRKLKQLRTDLQMQQTVKSLNDFHATLLKMFYAVFYVFMFAAMTAHYNCI